MAQKGGVSTDWSLCRLLIVWICRPGGCGLQVWQWWAASVNTVSIRPGIGQQGVFPSFDEFKVTSLSKASIELLALLR